MYVVVLAFSGSRVLLPNVVGMNEDPDGFHIHFVDSQGQTVATFRRPDVTIHGFEHDIPDTEGCA